MGEIAKDRVRVIFTPQAWTKMWGLVDHFPTEVAWNATVTRTGDAFLVDDILVHKQRVTGGTVRTDPAEYDEWLGAFDDETFERIRLHGHSHASMKPFPSQLDKELQEDIVSQLRDDQFYIFMIVNKNREVWARVVDLDDGWDYWADSVVCEVQTAYDLSAFLAEADELVERTFYYRKELLCDGSSEEL